MCIFARDDPVRETCCLAGARESAKKPKVHGSPGFRCWFLDRVEHTNRPSRMGCAGSQMFSGPAICLFLTYNSDADMPQGPSKRTPHRMRQKRPFWGGGGACSPSLALGKSRAHNKLGRASPPTLHTTPQNQEYHYFFWLSRPAPTASRKTSWRPFFCSFLVGDCRLVCVTASK